MKILALELWKELDAKHSEKISGGSSGDSDGCIAWSIGFADVVRPSGSQAPGAIALIAGKIRGTLLL